MFEDKSDQELWALLRDRHKRINDAADREARAAAADIGGPIRNGALQPAKDRAIADADAILDELEKRFNALRS